MDPISSNKLSPPFESIAPYYDELMESVPYAFWLKYLRNVWRQHRHEPQHVLDLACGTGTVSLMLAQEGFAVTGVDLSGQMLEEARSKSGATGIYVNYLQQDAARLSLPYDEYDTVISLFDSLNNILESGDLEACFRGVHRHMTSPGLFLFDLNTAYAFRQGMFNQKSTSADGPLQYRWKSTYDESSRLCTVTMSFRYDDGRGHRREFDEVHVQRAYANEEILRMLQTAGFDRVTAYDAYSLKPPKNRSDRIFYVAEVD